LALSTKPRVQEATTSSIVMKYGEEETSASSLRV